MAVIVFRYESLFVTCDVLIVVLLIDGGAISYCMSICNGHPRELGITTMG